MSRCAETRARRFFRAADRRRNALIFLIEEARTRMVRLKRERAL
jgi:hypothetical protein